MTTSVKLKSGPLALCLAGDKIADLSLETDRGQFSSLLVAPPPGSSVAATPASSDLFTIREAWGGDECFPTVGGLPERGIRDHGWLWGAPCRVESDDRRVTTQWTLSDGSIFTRQVTALSSESRAAGAFQFDLTFPSSVRIGQSGSLLTVYGLYASHLLFAAEAGDTLSVERNGLTFFTEIFPDLANRVARKFFCQWGEGACSVFWLKRRGIKVTLRQREGAPYLGIWWCNNGWGDGRDHRTVGIEPTNVPGDGPVLLPQSDMRTQGKLSFTCEVERLHAESHRL